MELPGRYQSSDEIKALLLGGQLQIQGCFHGWVILSNPPDRVLWSLWNPVTSKFIRLPPLTLTLTHDHTTVTSSCCLSSPPGDRGSIILFTLAESPIIVFRRLDLHRKHRRKWTKMSCAKQLRSIGCKDDHLSMLSSCNDRVYAESMDSDYNLILIQFDIVVKEGGKQVVITLQPLAKIPATATSFEPFQIPDTAATVYEFMKGSSTELFYISLIYIHEWRTADFKLFRLDFTSLMWEQVEDLKDSLLFLEDGASLGSAFYMSKVASDIGGYVHFLGERDTIISSFCVKDRTMSLLRPPCLARERQLLAWTMLECGLEANHHHHQPPESTKQEEKDKGNEIFVKETESNLLSIPFEILETIMELCLGVEYMKFRATCRRCSLAAPPIKWSSKAERRRLEMYSLASPWLMVLDNYRGIITFIDPICGGGGGDTDRYFMTVPEDLKKGDYHICCSRFGWLLMYELHQPLVFFNPFTSDIRELPEIHKLDSLCFSAPPTSPDCMVAGFKRRGQWHVFIHLVSREPSTWYSFQLDSGPYSYRFPAFNGPRDVYALRDNNNNKGLLDVFKDMSEDGDYSREVVVDKAPPITLTSSSSVSGCHDYYLSKCDEHVLLVMVGEFGGSVEVFRLNANANAKEWEKIDSLGKHMICISNTSCICLEAKSAEMENKIYFPRLLHNEVVFYSLETCRYHTFHDKIIQPDLFGTQHHCDPHTWIEPSWS